MPFSVTATFYGYSGTPGVAGPIVHQEDAFSLSSLRYSWKLNGGDALCTFELIGNMAGRLRWNSGIPDAYEILLTDGAGRDVWRGRFLEVKPNTDRRIFTVSYTGYYKDTGDHIIQNQVYNAGDAGNPLTMGTAILNNAAAMPYLIVDPAFIQDPGAIFNAPNGRTITVDHKTPRELFQELLPTGTGTTQYHIAVWADRRIRLFPRDLTLRWQATSEMLTGDAAHTLTQAHMYTDYWYAYRDSANNPQWKHLAAENVQDWGMTGYTMATDIQRRLGGVAREARVDNRLLNEWVGKALAERFGRDHAYPLDQGEGFTVGPEVLDAFGNRRTSMDIRPGHVFRNISVASSSLDVQRSIINEGTYYLTEVSVDVDKGTVTCLPDNPNPSIAQVLGQGV